MGPAATRRTVLAGLAGAAAASQVGAMGPAERRKVEVFGHRGASALRPEHTLAAYTRAIADGADFIEPDLVISKDGVLIARHEPNIADTTDVAKHPEFAGRRTTKLIDGKPQEGWFTEDFTLAELKTLRAIERLPQLRPANTAFDGQFGLVTWAEMVDFAAAEAKARGRMIGLVPELKHSTYFRSIGKPLEEAFLPTLRHSYLRRAPLVIQSFETANLKAVRAAIRRPRNVRLMQLIDPSSRPADVVAAGGDLTSAAMMTPDGLTTIAAYADIVAPDTRSIIPLDAQKRLAQPTALVANARAAGLQLMCYTFRPENYFLPADLQDGKGPAARNEAGSISEMRAYVAAGIDGLFTDDPALARRAVGA